MAGPTPRYFSFKRSHHSRFSVKFYYLLDNSQQVHVSKRYGADSAPYGKTPQPARHERKQCRTIIISRPFLTLRNPKPMSSTIAFSAVALSHILHQAWHSLQALCSPSTAFPAPTQQAQTQSVVPASQTNRHSPSTTSSCVSESSPSTVLSSVPATEYLHPFEKK